MATAKPKASPKVDTDAEIQAHPLYPILIDAIKQQLYGKGQVHGEGVPFLKQPIFHYGRLHGRGFLTGQAAKKLEEAASVKSGQEFIDEILGAVVYIGAAIILENETGEE